jgi:hypothetical protein
MKIKNARTNENNRKEKLLKSMANDTFIKSPDAIKILTR